MIAIEWGFFLYWYLKKSSVERTYKKELFSWIYQLLHTIVFKLSAIEKRDRLQKQNNEIFIIKKILR